MPVYNNNPRLAGEGTAVYQHNIRIYDEEALYQFTLVIINDSNTQMTYTDILNYLKTKGFTVEGDYEHGYTINAVYTLGVTGGMGGATGEGVDSCFVITIETDTEVFEDVIAFHILGYSGITDCIETSSNATVQDIII